VDHIDYSNIPFGWCAVWALGSYNLKKGGHLVLWPVKKVIQFPPGSLIFVPSGSCRHSNTRIRLHEQRFSFTQYTLGGLFYWVDHGYQTEEKYLDSLDKEGLLKNEKERQERWRIGVGLFSSLEDFNIGEVSRANRVGKLKLSNEFLSTSHPTFPN
jgi:hypothetical protein